jgi:hypothetical protein
MGTTSANETISTWREQQQQQQQQETLSGDDIDQSI